MDGPAVTYRLALAAHAREPGRWPDASAAWEELLSAGSEQVLALHGLFAAGLTLTQAEQVLARLA